MKNVWGFLTSPRIDGIGFCSKKKGPYELPNFVLSALASRDEKKKKKPYFVPSNTTLSILPIHFIIYSTSQFLFLHTT